MKIIFVLLFVLTGDAFAQTNVDLSKDTIQWSPKYKLKKEDFQGSPDTTITTVAKTVYKISLFSTYNKDSSLIIFKTACILFKNSSWIKDGWKSPYILNHERGHLIIAEVMSRKFLFYLNSIDQSSAKGHLQNIVDSIYNEISIEDDYFQNMYDEETSAPLKPKKQREWDDRLKEWLFESEKQYLK